MKTPARLSVVLLLALLARPLAAADLAPSWTLVPETTALVVRANLAKFVAALRQQTKFGAVVLSEDRVRRGLELWQSEKKGVWEEFSKDLGKQGLMPDDLAQLFDGEVGIALTVAPRDDRSPLVVGLAWAEPGEDLAERLVKAIAGAIEGRSGDKYPPSRIDLELAGAEVMHLTLPVTQPEAVDPADFSPDDLDDLTPEKAKKLREEQEEKLKNRKLIEVDRRHVFVARLGGRMLLASTFPQSSAEVTRMDEDARREIDWDQLTGAEEAAGVFARFLGAHAGQVEGGLLDAPGIAATLRRAALLVGSSPDEGVVLLEALGNPQPLLKSAGGDTAKTLEAFGVGTIGPLALRVSLNDRALRTGLFLSIPEPRQGLLALLDQPSLPAAPPEWVPSGIVEFQQISFDLGGAFTKIKELAIAQG
ncbi:MAG TPA: hypothetical protein VN699_19400, partial [Pirellulales bacterium]|nr:hypothetical protein [Pirellulales bacterium]